ncbi:MAG: DUF427 domain-containing protein [Proteobacteria bacterium]|nr:DUF427 domain-containing protein [Pseudomonadota bacterium]
MRVRPANIPRPGPGQESVWDYPRPPRVEAVARTIRVEFAEEVVAESGRALRVVETASPPVYYIPPDDVRRDLLVPEVHETFCEWKGIARYWSLRVDGRTAKGAAWSYPDPDPEFASIRDHIAFHPGRVDACTVGDDRVIPQPGEYYGGWITPELVGPFKGEPGSEGW